MEIISKLSCIGIDTNVGLKYCDDIDLYKEILKISVETSADKLCSLERSLEDKDYKGYTIVVHSIKSGMANIGAMEISQLARKLEDAGKAGNYPYIEENSEEFIFKYKSLMGNVREILDIKSETVSARGNKYITPEELDNLLSKMEYYLGELELDEAEGLLDEVLAYKTKDKVYELLCHIRKKLQVFDVEGAKESISTIRDVENIL